MGATPDEARADAATQEIPASDLDDLEIHEISNVQAAAVESGDVSWPSGAGA